MQRILPKIFKEELGAQEEKGEHARLVSVNTSEKRPHVSAVSIHWSHRCRRFSEDNIGPQGNGTQSNSVSVLTLPVGQNFAADGRWQGARDGHK